MPVLCNSAVTVCNNSYFHSFLLLSDFAFLYFELLFADVFMYKPVNGLINCNNQFQEPSMSSKTKIFVLKSRNLIWTAVIVVIVILLAVLLASALHLDKNQSRSFPKDMTESASSSIVSSQSFRIQKASHFLVLTYQEDTPHLLFWAVIQLILSCVWTKITLIRFVPTTLLNQLPRCIRSSLPYCKVWNHRFFLRRACRA